VGSSQRCCWQPFRATEVAALTLDATMTRQTDQRWLWSLTRNERGFTLIELLVVIIVLGLLVGLVGPRLFGRVGQSKQAAARAQIELFGAALDQYRLDVVSYPTAGGRGSTRFSGTRTSRAGTGRISRRPCPRTPGATLQVPLLSRPIRGVRPVVRRRGRRPRRRRHLKSDLDLTVPFEGRVLPLAA
jgi:prepilin-type N-terminal cleavage/methylation domain-containing protein